MTTSYYLHVEHTVYSPVMYPLPFTYRSCDCLLTYAYKSPKVTITALVKVVEFINVLGPSDFLNDSEFLLISLWDLWA